MCQGSSEWRMVGRLLKDFAYMQVHERLCSYAGQWKTLLICRSMKDFSDMQVHERFCCYAGPWKIFLICRFMKDFSDTQVHERFCWYAGSWKTFDMQVQEILSKCRPVKEFADRQVIEKNWLVYRIMNDFTGLQVYERLYWYAGLWKTISACRFMKGFAGIKVSERLSACAGAWKALLVWRIVKDFAACLAGSEEHCQSTVAWRSLLVYQYAWNSDILQVHGRFYWVKRSSETLLSRRFMKEFVGLMDQVRDL